MDFNPAEINFLGKQVVVPYIGGRRLTRIAASLHELTKLTKLDTPEARVLLQLENYPALVMMALSAIITNLSHGQYLTRAEELFYGTLADMISNNGAAFDAEAVADAPLDQLTELVVTIVNQERETQAGKAIMSILLTLGRPNTTNSETASNGKSNLESDQTTEAPDDLPEATMDELTQATATIGIAMDGG